MSVLPEHRCVLAGRTWEQPWEPASMDPIQHYPNPSSRLATIAYGVVCLLASALIGYLLAQGF
jgi:hypothetical protein